MSISFLRFLCLLAAISLATPRFCDGGGTHLDRFGRVKDLDFKKTAATVHRYQYDYDKAGNRTYARVTQATIGATTHENDRSYLYGYDDLQRLILAHMGKLSTSNQSILDDPAVALRRKLEWFPDSLGNWSGTVEPDITPGGLTRTDKTPGQDPITTEIRHEVDAFNRIEAVTTDSQPVAHVNDSAGNLVFDGVYVYQYDAWNRLTEVNDAGSLTTDDFTSDGKISQTTGHEIGDLVVRFQYDGLGRLIMAQRVHSGSPPAPVYRTEHYYYDGVRRIQTVDDNGTPANSADDLTQHEYVYGPEYVDEFVLQSQRTVVGEQVVQKSFYMLQDANYNVMALLDDTGAVIEQYQWEPYGSLATLDTTASPRPDNSVGHQGLFFYRFDSGDTLSLNALGLYYNRNRWYSPNLGRFTSRDPIETAQLVVSAAISNAQTFSIVAGAFTVTGHFVDGMNLFAYQGSNPVNRSDAGGLDFWDDEIDNQISDLTGNKLYALGMINDMSRNVGLGLRTALGVAASLLPGAGLYDAFNSVVAIANGSGGFWDAINIAMAAVPAAKAASKMLGMASLAKAWRYGARACNCFVAGTLVDTPWGARPIEEIEPGDEVMTCPQNEPGSPPRPGRVTRVFRNLAPVMLWLSLSNGWEVGTTPGHEVWTCQDGWTSAGNLETGDLFIGSDGQPVEVLAIRIDPTPTLVYNFEVDGTFTYYAAGVWVHNDSCSRIAHAVGDGLNRLFDIVPYSEAQKLTAGHGGQIVGHHILELRWAEKFGVKNLDDMPAVILPWNVHDPITATLNSRWAAKANWTKREILEVYEQVYAGQSDWLNAIRKFLE